MDFVWVKEVSLGPHHRQPERVGATITADGTMDPASPFSTLELAHYEGDESYYLFHISADGQSTDTWHETLNDAFKHAEQLYGVQRHEWTDITKR